jgi:hypothetical protein
MTGFWQVDFDSGLSACLSDLGACSFNFQNLGTVNMITWSPTARLWSSQSPSIQGRYISSTLVILLMVSPDSQNVLANIIVGLVYSETNTWFTGETGALFRFEYADDTIQEVERTFR